MLLSLLEKYMALPSAEIAELASWYLVFIVEPISSWTLPFAIFIFGNIHIKIPTAWIIFAVIIIADREI